jgi:hypothetical protein
MGAVGVDPLSGRLTCDGATFARLKALVAEGAASLDPSIQSVRPSRPQPRRTIELQTDGTAPAQLVRPLESQAVPVAPPPADVEIEALLGGLMVEVYVAAKKSFALAHNYTQPGQAAEMRDMHIGQAARLTRAYAELVEALARRRGMRVEHTHQHFHRRVP